MDSIREKYNCGEANSREAFEELFHLVQSIEASTSRLKLEFMVLIFDFFLNSGRKIFPQILPLDQLCASLKA